MNEVNNFATIGLVHYDALQGELAVARYENKQFRTENEHLRAENEHLCARLNATAASGDELDQLRADNEHCNILIDRLRAENASLRDALASAGLGEEIDD